MSIPVSRVAEVISEDSVNKVSHIHSKPKFYKDSEGNYHHPDLTFNDTTTNIGNITLMNKSVYSVGIRKDDNPAKFMGIRPDCNQSGSEQIEFTLNSVKLDNVPQTLDLSTNLVKVLKNGVLRHMVPNNKTSRSFKVEYNINLTGVEVLNDKYESVKDVIQPINVGYVEHGLMDGDDILTAQKLINSDEALYESYSDTPDKNLFVHIGQIQDEYILLGGYNREDEFTDSTLDGYNTNQIYFKGSSMYMKDAIFLNIVQENLNYPEELMVSIIQDILGAEKFKDENGTGEYFTINDKKVGAWYVDNGSFLAMFNTADIPDKIKTLFKDKDFSSTSHINMSLDEFTTKLKERLTVSIDTVSVDTSYYKLDADYIRLKFNDMPLYIALPVLYDENFKAMDSKTTHTLQDLGNDVYRYTKYLTSEGILEDKLKECSYIDTNITSSGDVTYQRLGYYGFTYPGSWSTILNMSLWAITTHGTGLNFLMEEQKLNFKAPHYFKSTESHHKFDCSSITSLVTSLQLKYWHNADTNFFNTTAHQRWRKVNYLTAAFDTATSVRDYAAPIYCSGGISAILPAGNTGSDVEVTVILNATARAALPYEPFFAMACIGRALDSYYTDAGVYNNTSGAEPSVLGYLSQKFYSVEETDATAVPPYLVVTSAVATADNAVLFGTLF